jgi:hypothetical protein
LHRRDRTTCWLANVVTVQRISTVFSAEYDSDRHTRWKKKKKKFKSAVRLSRAGCPNPLNGGPNIY